MTKEGRQREKGGCLTLVVAVVADFWCHGQEGDGKEGGPGEAV